jgi:hypothetical protein
MSRPHELLLCFGKISREVFDTFGSIQTRPSATSTLVKISAGFMSSWLCLTPTVESTCRESSGLRHLIWTSAAKTPLRQTFVGIANQTDRLAQRSLHPHGGSELHPWPIESPTKLSATGAKPVFHGGAKPDPLHYECRPPAERPSPGKSRTAC